MTRTTVRSAQLAVSAALALLLAGCGESIEEIAAKKRPVEVALAAPTAVPQGLQLTGSIEALSDVPMAFRIAGKLVERPVSVGDRVAAGDVLARLDTALEENAVTAAKAAVDAARGEAERATIDAERQDDLLARGFTTRSRQEQARTAAERAEASLDAAEAELRLARDRLRFATLVADVDGTVVAVASEPGEVVQVGQPVVRIATDEGRDAVFDVPSRMISDGAVDVRVAVSPVDDPARSIEGIVREVAAQADPVTRTIRVRVTIEDPDGSLPIGTAVVGTVSQESDAVIAVPSRTLTWSGRYPAVWVINPDDSTVSLRTVDVLRFDAARVLLSGGLYEGEAVVSGGIHALFPGQVVDPVTAGATE